MSTDDEQMSPATANAIGELAAELMQVLLDDPKKHPELDWLHRVSAVALAMRSLGTVERRANPLLTPDMALSMVALACLRVLHLPEEVIKVVDGPGPDKAGHIRVNVQ